MENEQLQFSVTKSSGTLHWKKKKQHLEILLPPHSVGHQGERSDERGEKQKR